MTHHDLDHHHHVPGLLQTSKIMAFHSSLSSVLLMSSLLGDSFLVTKFFRLSVYFVRCLLLLLVQQIFPLNICFSSPSALFICSKNCCSLLWCFWRATFCIRPFPFPSFDFFSVHDILIILLCTTFLLLQVLFLGLLSVSSIHIHAGSQVVDFGVNSDISEGENGLHPGEWLCL